MQIRLPEFNNVAAGQMATLDLWNATKGFVLDRINLRLINITKAQVEQITIKANLSPIWQIGQDAGVVLDQLRSFLGITADPNFLTIDFTDPKCKEFFSAILGSLDTVLSGTKSLTLEIKLATGLTNPRIIGTAETSSRTTSQLDAGVDKVSRITTVINNVNVTNPREPIQIPFQVGSNALIKKIHFNPTAGVTINSAEVRKNNVIIHEFDKATNDFVLKEFGRVPQSDWYTLDFIKEDHMLGKALTLTDVDNGQGVSANMQYYLDVTVATPGAIYTIVEYIDTIDGR